MLFFIGITIYVLGVLFFLILSIGNSQSENPISFENVITCLAWPIGLLAELFKSIIKK